MVIVKAVTLLNLIIGWWIYGGEGENRLTLLPIDLSYHHFHCCSDKSVGVILPSSVGPIERPPKDGNRQLKTINAAVTVGLNSTIVWNAKLTRIGVLAAALYDRLVYQR